MDDNPNTRAQPIVTPSEAWHIARGQAYEQASAIVAEAASERPGTELERILMGICEQFNDASADAWAQYLSYGDRPVNFVSRDDVTIDFDEARDLPMMHWHTTQLQDASWGMVDFPAPDDAGDPSQGMVMATPFRVIDLNRLPKGHMLVRLQDPHHAATAALVEVLQCSRRDAASAFMGCDEVQSWRRMNGVINIYRQAAATSLSMLNDDDYVGWRPSQPEGFNIGSAASIIVRVASTARAQCAIATHLVSAWLQSLADHFSGIEGDGRVQFLKELESATGSLEATLSGMNDALARDYWADDQPRSCMVVFRTPQSDVPALAIIPSEEKPQVAKLPRKRGQKKKA